ncbi:MAG: preprotein translocase subunit YajC [Actinomycetota bacterium]
MPNSRARAVVVRLGVFALAVTVALLSAACVPPSTSSTTAAGDTTGTTAANGGSSGGSVIMTIVMYAAVIGGLFYFLLVRPQRTRQRRSQELQSSLGVGDEVQTIGGIYGTIEYFDEETDTAVLQVEGGGKIRVARRALADKVKPKGR